MRTLEDINAELEQVRQKLDRARKLSAVMEDLKAQHEERKRAAEDALKVLYREQERWPEGAQDTNTSPLKGYIRFRMKEMDRYVKTLPTDKEDFDAQNLLQ